MAGGAATRPRFFMALTLHLHPLASFCHKVLIALYENGTPFTPKTIDFEDENTTLRLLTVWPVGKIPVLDDAERGETVPETTIILEYLDRHYPGPVKLIPEDPGKALETRLWDRFFDLYVSQPMQKIVLDRLRPEGKHDPLGLDEAGVTLAVSYEMLEARMKSREWVAAGTFTMADCSAAPALFFAEAIQPFRKDYPALGAYFERLLARPSFRQVLDEARPYFPNFPYHERIAPEFLR